MGSTQKYSLKWNDFTVNVASTFRDLHSRHDFVDVTLACSDGSTLEAHKVILSSVSSYFRDILKTNPCKHPIVILKDTNRDEAQAMLEFAYTGEVNVAQDLLPTLLHTARSYKIKGLDKVESPVDPPQQTLGNRLEAQTPGSEQWVESAPPTRSHTPSSVHSHTTGSATAPGVDHFMTSNGGVSGNISTTNDKASPNGINFANGNFLLNVAREREAQQNSSSPPSLPSSQPPTRETSPSPHHAAALNNARTPPPKRWKRSFDLTHHPGQHPIINKEQPLPLLTEKYSPQNSRDYEHHNSNNSTTPVPAKRYCEPSQSNGDISTTAPAGATNGHAINGRAPVGTGSTNPGNNSRSLPYPHSMPTSPTMFERGNEVRLAGLFRHHLASDLTRAAVVSTAGTLVNGSLNGRMEVGSPPNGEIHINSKIVTNGPTQQQASSTTNSGENALDYTNRCYANQQPKIEPQSESDYLHGRSNGTERGNGAEESEAERYPGRSIGFRPESAPTVLDMSPEGSLSGPPSVRNMDLNEMNHRDDEVHGHFNGDDEYLNKGYGITPDAMGRYTCDECGKIFKHPGSLQHHRHIHRGTHRCPSCGKVFSRRWDMERHLNKSKYGCPANRFSTGSSGSSTGSSGGGNTNTGMTVTVTGPTILPSITTSAIASTAAAHLEMLAAASSVASSTNGVPSLGPNAQHNTTA